MKHERTDSSTPDPRLAAALAEIVEDERRDAPPPSIEEMLARLEGELGPEEEEAFDERLALHPEAARRFLELADPPAAAGGADVPRPDQEMLRRRLDNEGLFDPQGGVVPFPVPEHREAGVHPGYRWAAAALLLLSLGLGAALVLRAPSPVEPAAVADVAFVELVPRSDSGRREAGEELVADPGFVYDLVLWADEAMPGRVHRLIVVDGTESEVLRRDLRTNVAGRVILRLAVGDLAPGRYELRLFAADEDVLLAVYDFAWSAP